MTAVRLSAAQASVTDPNPRPGSRRQGGAGYWGEAAGYSGSAAGHSGPARCRLLVIRMAKNREARIYRRKSAISGPDRIYHRIYQQSIYGPVPTLAQVSSAVAPTHATSAAARQYGQTRPSAASRRRRIVARRPPGGLCTFLYSKVNRAWGGNISCPSDTVCILRQINNRQERQLGVDTYMALGDNIGSFA